MLATTPLLSIRLITFNHQEFIDDAIKSILKQEVNFLIEVVVGDDFSSDNTLQKIRSFKDTENIVFKILERKVGDEYWINRQRYGRLYNFLDTTRNCAGKYVAFLDGDDLWSDPHKLQKQVDFLESSPDHVLAFHGWTNFKGNPSLKESDTMKIVHSPRIITLVVRNKYLNFPEEFLEVPNGDAFLRFMLKQHGKFASLTDIRPSMRRIHADNVMGNLSEFDKLPRRILTHEKLLQVYSESKIKHILIRKIAQYKIRYEVLLAMRQPLYARITPLLKASTLAIKSNLLRSSLQFLVYNWSFKKIKH